MFLLKYMGYSGFTSCETSEMEIEGVFTKINTSNIYTVSGQILIQFSAISLG